MPRILLILAIICLPMLAAQAEPGLTEHVAEYKIKISVLGGRLTTQLRRSEDGYAANHVIVPTGMSKILANGEINETSQFAINSDGVLPLQYQSRDGLSKKKTQADFTFDWADEILSGQANGEQVEMPLDESLHDRISIQYQLMHDLLTGETNDQYDMFDIDEIKRLNIRNVGEKRVKTPAGSFDAIGIQHQAENSSRITTLWCVPEMDYLPVIIEQHRKGKLKLRASLKKYEKLEDVQVNVIDN